ncbi:hypothetical protein QR680_002898 [Steinernema hermaphroditum]|uniref:Uncharacterized protein n=1 Tax=Steinernema hermaphroditum TaxID=289476 RepID=A0AA39H4I0_9BILA|nr:hypothetical protein QR680_002898 [Steinernema hermaphroditum]
MPSKPKADESKQKGEEKKRSEEQKKKKEPEQSTSKRQKAIMRPVISKAATTTCAALNKQDKKQSGKDEKKSADSGGRGRGRGRGRGGRGGRGGGRGGHAQHKTTYTAAELDEMARQAGTVELLPSNELFEGSKKDRRQRFEEQDRAKNEKVVGYIVEEKRETRVTKDRSQAGLLAYEDEWLSDREADEEAMEKLMREGTSILDDIADGDIVPKVLPHRDMPSVKSACDYDPKTSYIEPQIDIKGNIIPTPLRSMEHLIKQGGKEMRNLLDVVNYDHPIVMQFPAGTMDLKEIWAASQKKKLEKKGAEPQAVRSSFDKADQFDTDDLTVFDDEYVHGLDDLDNGTKIGKMQFTKSGRCYLKMRGSSERLTISKSVYENKIKNVLALIPERGAQEEEPMAVLGVQEGGNSEKEKTVDILGIAEKFFVCSFETTKICGKNLRDKADKRDTEPFRSMHSHKVSYKCYREWMTGKPVAYDKEEEKYLENAKKCLEQEIEAQKKAAVHIEKKNALLGQLLKKRRGNSFEEMIAKAKN